MLPQQPGHKDILRAGDFWKHRDLLSGPVFVHSMTVPQLSATFEGVAQALHTNAVTIIIDKNKTMRVLFMAVTPLYCINIIV